MEGGAELAPDVMDMAGDKDVDGMGEIHAEKLILFSNGKEQLRAWIDSDVS